MAVSTPASPAIGSGRFTNRILRVRHSYASPLERQRAAVVSVLGTVFGVAGIAGTVALWLVLPARFPAALVLPNILLGGLYLVAYALAQHGRLRLASIMLVLLALVVPTLLAVPHGFLNTEALALSYGVSVMLASFLITPGWSYVIAAVAALGTLLSALMQLSADAPPGTVLSGLLISTFLLGVLALLGWLLSSSMIAWASSAQRRASQLEAAVVISETAARGPGLETLLNEVIERIREAYGFYHAQVFLLDDERRMARLVASTGRAGEELLARRHALPVGSRSVIGQCTFGGQPVVVNNVHESETHRPNPLLPDTAAELALPLLAGGQVIGALDVQSTVVDAFPPDDVRALQIMAAQLTAAIENARLLDALESRARENERLYEKAQETVSQIEELNRLLTREGWNEYLRLRRAQGALGYTLQGDNLSPDTSWTAPMRQAYQGEHGVVIRQDPQAHIAALPVRVRGEVIGVLEVARGEERPWSDGEIDLAVTLVDRLALALENARLYEQAKQASEREAIVNRISQDVQRAESVDQVLQAALAELSHALGASRGVVQISPRTEWSPGGEAAAPAADQGG
jgi:GAF domain-containing protein